MAFKEKKISGIVIPDSVIEIGESAFSLCKNLENVTIGNSVTGIGNNAFMKCDNLESITIPSSVVKIGKEAFLGCLGLTRVTFECKLDHDGFDFYDVFPGNLRSEYFENGKGTYIMTDIKKEIWTFKEK